MRNIYGIIRRGAGKHEESQLEHEASIENKEHGATALKRGSNGFSNFRKTDEHPARFGERQDDSEWPRATEVPRALCPTALPRRLSTAARPSRTRLPNYDAGR